MNPPASSPKRYGALMIRYLKPLRFKVVLLALLIFANIGLQLINPQLIRYFIDTALNQGQMQTLLGAALTFLGASLLLQGIDVAATYTGEDVGWRSTNHLRADLAEHCLGLDMAFHHRHTPGEMIERLDGDVAEIANFFAHFAIRVVGNMLLVIGILLVLIGVDWRISLALALFAGVALTSFILVRDIAVPHWQAARQASANLFGFLEEHLAGTEDLRANGAVAYVMHHLLRLNKLRQDTALRGESVSVFVIWVWFGMQTLGLTVAFIGSYLLFQRGILTIGTVYLIVHYTQSMFQPLRAISNEIQGVQKAAASIERVAALYAQESTIKTSGQKTLPQGPLTVIFDDVSFGYSAETPILHNVSFQLAPGDVLGLLGRTGSGKTTLTRLLFRLYDPTRGAIRLGNNGRGDDIRETDLSHLRRQIGLVTQDVQLFRASVRDNLTFFNKNISDRAILDVITELGLARWYEALPQGLDTYLTSGGRNLSAGEAQLLALTRVFLKQPGLVILDEAASRLDPATESLIEGAMGKLLQGRTGIIIAHRLKTVQKVDQIMIIEGGRIQEFAPYQVLANNPASRLYALLQMGLNSLEETEETEAAEEVLK